VARAKDDGRPPPGLKVELPQFKVKQARAWLEQLESIFDASRAEDAWRVVLSMQRMDMESAKATRSRLQREGLGNPTWVQFKEVILHLYDEREQSIPAARRLAKLKQGSKSLMEYLRMWDDCINKIKAEDMVPRHQWLKWFREGLTSLKLADEIAKPSVNEGWHDYDQLRDAVVKIFNAAPELYLPERSERGPSQRPTPRDREASRSGQRFGAQEDHSRTHRGKRGKKRSRRDMQGDAREGAKGSDASRGPRCFRCQGYGHLAKNCPSREGGGGGSYQRSDAQRGTQFRTPDGGGGRGGFGGPRGRGGRGNGNGAGRGDGKRPVN